MQGVCSLAPVFVIGEETFGRIENQTRVHEILEKIKPKKIKIQSEEK